MTSAVVGFGSESNGTLDEVPAGLLGDGLAQIRTLAAGETPQRDGPGRARHPLHKYINQGRVEADRPAVSPRRLTGYLLTHPDHRSQRQQDTFESFTTACPEMTALTGLVHSFAALLKPVSSNADRLTEWINAARQEGLPHLPALTRGLDRDRDAVDAAVTLPHHNGTAEGVNTKNQAAQTPNVWKSRFRTAPPPRSARLTPHSPSPPKVRQSRYLDRPP
ncbi:transposase [Actinoplanes sp. NEAU-A12]|uniref:Transposase n=1 Tax=Actinoplanes sandaracinus TaxID=3045177 RepID=A0ABT6WRG3_9ACTN|nr:transposase [Actinoplanes sandaracinus]MDI6102327.1 transposase [Actinoplanes sandaracinus]